MQPPLTLNVATPRCAKSRTTESRSGLPAFMAVGRRLVDERADHGQGAHADLDPVARLAAGPPAQGHGLAPLALRRRSIFEVEAALLAGHDDIPVPQILFVQREQAADAGPVVVDEALGIAVGVVVSGALEHDLAAGAAT